MRVGNVVKLRLGRLGLPAQAEDEARPRDRMGLKAVHRSLRPISRPGLAFIQTSADELDSGIHCPLKRTSQTPNSRALVQINPRSPRVAAHENRRRI